MARPTKFAPEVRERASRMVLEHQGDHASQWAAIESIAGKMGCSAETLRKWVRQAECDHGVRTGLTSSERERLKSLARESGNQDDDPGAGSPAHPHLGPPAIHRRVVAVAGRQSRRP